GFVEATQEMNLAPQVTGQIVGKYFKGGDTVQAGQVLYEIDPRTYKANLLSAEGNLASARAALANAEMDAERYTKLYEQNAVSKQMLDNAVTARDQARASVKALEGLLLNAQINMEETKVTAPFTGRTDTSSLEVGNYVAAGQSVLTKISNTDPVFVKFSIAEPEYLTLAAASDGNGAALDNLSAVLANGETYGLKGKVAEVNRGISDNTGTLTIKATFQNPKKELLPGMFAHIQATGGVRENALLIPQRSVTELMYKNFVYVVGADNKVIMKEIKLGQKVGRLIMVNGGLTGEETLVVEGVGKMRQGALVDPQPMTEADLNTVEEK
ncbi:MAG: efflux RND transporter periplasmic adaptor subunit, partial [Phascolarctobacterium sp.]|nr:efflux RND transporter periplasmic adaptor subunit [Phascolarctobacterium sp.]